MEGLILLSAGLLAVLYSLASALDIENLLLIAKLALTNSLTTLVFVLVCELRRANFNHHDLIVEIVVLHRDQSAHIRLERVTREVYS